MARLNWGKVRTDANIRRYGTEPVAEGLVIAPMPKKKGRRGSPKGAAQKTVAATGSIVLGQASGKSGAELKFIADKELSARAAQKAKNIAVAQARSDAKNRKRLEEEQRVRKAQAAKAARKVLHEAQMAVARDKRRKRIEAQAAREAQKKADPDYLVKQSAKVSNRLTQRMKSVVVVKKRRSAPPSAAPR